MPHYAREKDTHGWERKSVKLVGFQRVGRGKLTIKEAKKKLLDRLVELGFIPEQEKWDRKYQWGVSFAVHCKWSAEDEEGYTYLEKSLETRVLKMDYVSTPINRGK